MPETAAVGDCYQVRLIGLIEGQQTQNVLHFICVGADTDVLTHLIQVLVDCFQTHLIPVLSSAWELTEIRFKRVSPTLGPETIVVANVAATGGGNAAALPSYCSAVFSERTIRGGKSGRGRMYLPGIPEDQTIGSRFDKDGAMWAALLAFAACVVINFVHLDPAGASNAWDLAVYSRKIGGSTFPYGGAGFAAVREFVPSEFLGTTRSRKVGRGS